MKNLTDLRRRARLSKAELARQAEAALPALPPVRITGDYITDMETGRNKNPSALIILRVAKVLGCAPEELFMPPTEDAQP